MKRKPTAVAIAAALSILGSTAAVASEPQALTLEQVKQAQVAQAARGEFDYARYQSLYIPATAFSNDRLGTAPVALPLPGARPGYRGYSPEMIAALGGWGNVFEAKLALPQGAKVCYIGLDAYDADPQNGGNIRAWIRGYSGFDDANPPSLEDIDGTVESVDTGTSHFNYTAAAIMPYSIGTGIMLPNCITVNNDVHNLGGTGFGYDYRVVVSVPPSAEIVGFRGVEVRWYRQPAPAPATATFSDVPSSHWAFQQIEAFKASGITSGTSAATYSPEAPVTRAQMAIFMTRALGLGWKE